MPLRDEFEKKIADLRDQIRDAKSRGNQELAAKLEIDLAVAKDDLEILNECNADIDVEYHSSDPIQNYLHKKMRF